MSIELNDRRLVSVYEAKDEKFNHFKEHFKGKYMINRHRKI